MALRNFLVLTFILYGLVVPSSGARLNFDDRFKIGGDDSYHLGNHQFLHKSSPVISQQISSIPEKLTHQLSNNYSFNEPVQEIQQSEVSSSHSASDPCNANSCENGGICIPTGQESYECKCVGPWRGTDCTIADACYDSPCENGGMCLNVHDDYWCQCPSDYYGINCQKKYSNAKHPKSNCRPNLCHSGVCYSFNNAYYCQCPKDRYGDHCEKRVSKRQIPSLQYYRDALKELKGNTPIYVDTNTVNDNNQDEIAIYDAANGIFF